MQRTNPAYAHLAYRKTLFTEAIALLRRRYLADESGEAPATLVCEEVFVGDSEVPQEEIQRFVNELETEKVGVELEMKKFEFVRKNEPQRASDSKGSNSGQGRYSKKKSKANRQQ